MRLWALALITATLGLLYMTGAHEQLTIAAMRERLEALRALHAARPQAVVAGFMLIQIVALALCLPGAVLSLSLLAGALFGPWLGTLVVLASVTLGDSLGFLIARYLLRDLLARRLRNQLDRVRAGEGATYLLALRMMAVVPYFLVNIAMAMSAMKLRVFAPVSLIGLVPATILYVNAGAALGEIEGPGDIYTPTLIACFVALGTLPVAARWAWRRWR